jgi:hypothetical protein
LGQGQLNDVSPGRLGRHKTISAEEYPFHYEKTPAGEAKMEVFLTVEARDVREKRDPKFEIRGLKFRRTRTSDFELSCAN